MNSQDQQVEDLLTQQMLPCTHCGSSGLLRKKGNSISYWLASCFQCRASVKGTTALDALEGWNRRPSGAYVPLEESSFLLPAGQKYQHLMVFDGGKVVNFIDYGDERVAAEAEIVLGLFRICQWKKGEKE